MLFNIFLVPPKAGFFLSMFFGSKEPPIVISIGGSLIVPNGGIDFDFLTKLHEFIRKQVKNGRRFFLVAGGGKTARHYRDAGKAVIGDIRDEDLDWLGIHATHLNAHLLRTIFQDIAHPRIIENYDKKLYNWDEPIVIGAGWKPGWSTDYDAVILARDYGCHLIINLSDIDWIYDKDPNKFKDAKPIKKMAWSEIEPFVGTKWVPGSNAPFDPIAAKLAEKLHLTVIVANGRDFANLQQILDGEQFKGTVIMPFKIDAGFYDREYYIAKKGEYRFVGYSESWLGKFTQNLTNFYRAALIKIFFNPKNCLDVGCGTGYLIKWLRFFGIKAEGIEISRDALELAEKEVKPHLAIGDISKLPYDKNSFDLVLTFDVLEHIERSKIKQAISETVRISRKHIFHKIFTRENAWIHMFHGKDISHVSVLPKKTWQRFFSSFDTVSIVRGGFFKLPSFFETIFVLKKK